MSAAFALTLHAIHTPLLYCLLIRLKDLTDYSVDELVNTITEALTTSSIYCFRISTRSELDRIFYKRNYSARGWPADLLQLRRART